MQKLYKNFYSFKFQKGIVSVETIPGYTVVEFNTKQPTKPCSSYTLKID